MLFLAVFCGFFAEYQLEHKIKRDRAKEFVVSLMQDLKKAKIEYSYRLVFIEYLQKIEGHDQKNTVNWQLKFSPGFI